jgi:gluconate 2-dehydrogenase gamma chain
MQAGAATGFIATAAVVTLTTPGAESDTEAQTAPTATHGATGTPGQGAAQAQAPSTPGFTTLNPQEIQVLAAATARIIPTDDSGPGATEAGVIYFIDRQLRTEAYYRGKRYTQGPFDPAAPANFGDQNGMSIRDRFGAGVAGMDAYAQKKYQNGFKDLPADQQDQVLRDMEAGNATEFTLIDPKAFFALLRSFTVAGFFADPVHGGNQNMTGWKFIGFPGVQNYQDSISRYGQKFDQPFRSIADRQVQISGVGTSSNPMQMG